jgi:RNA polymerase sigma-70 factor (ECF subfamily)
VTFVISYGAWFSSVSLVVVVRMEADNGLLDGAKSMNQEALVKIFDLYSTPLYNYALRLCNDPLEADQIVGDVFAKLLEQLSVGHGPSTNLRSYLYETTYHLIIDKSRSSRREAPLETIDFLRSDGFSPLTSLEDRLLFETVILAIKNNLTEDQRHVIILRFFEGFSLRETADIIGKEVYNVKVIQNRGVAKLRKALGYKVVS